ncbi:MAG: hypothetical protein JW829_15075 [Pirellulales bacterium]|nr:hypothetical protein [Pirellulales bacterium]
MLTASQEKYQEILSIAEDLFRQDTDWVTFFREVLGTDGIIRKAFPESKQLTHFENSEEYAKIQRLLTKLREKKSTGDSDSEPTRVITVRLPKSMHEFLRTEAGEKRTSMNKLCISKLLQMIEDDYVPIEQSSNVRKRNAEPNRFDSAVPEEQPLQPYRGEL